MKNLVLTSTFCYDERIHKFIDSHKKHDDPIFTIIPAFTKFNLEDEIEVSYKNSVYKKYGVKPENIRVFDVCFFFNENKIDSLLESDVILLGGGNTFLFRFLLKRNGLFPILKEYVNNGGILIGESAGSIMMSNDIEIANFADKDIIGGDTQGLGLVNFEIKPHFDSWHKKLPMFLKYSYERNSCLYCLYEGSFIIVEEDLATLYGDYFVIKNGELMW